MENDIEISYFSMAADCLIQAGFSCNETDRNGLLQVVKLLQFMYKSNSTLNDISKVAPQVKTLRDEWAMTAYLSRMHSLSECYTLADQAIAISKETGE